MLQEWRGRVNPGRKAERLKYNLANTDYAAGIFTHAIMEWKR